MKLIDTTGKTNWKFIAIVAFVAVFLAGGILVLIPQLKEPTMPLPQQNNSQIDTSDNATDSVQNWQTYRSDEFGFEVKYPGTLHYWFYDVSNGQPDIFGNSLLSVVMRQDGGLASVRLSVYSAQGYFAPEAIDVLAWISDHKPTTPEGDSLLLGEIKEDTLGNHSARVVHKFSFDSRQRATIVGYGNYIYVASFDELNPTDPELEEHLTTYNQILSTFRFVE